MALINSEHKTHELRLVTMTMQPVRLSLFLSLVPLLV